MVQPARPLFDRRLVIVTGKGGTGKTTVAACLALAASKQGRKVLIVEVGRDEHVPRLLSPGTGPVGYAGASLAPRLTAVRIDPYEALAEYLKLQVGMGMLVHRVLGNRAFRQLMDAAPGWRELITLGKIWHFEQMRDDGGESRFDLVVVDAPATGHGITFLDIPRVVVSAVRAGPLHRHSEWVEELVRDEARTVLLPVTLAEELPTRETVELVRRAREALRVAVDRVVVNAVVADPFPVRVPDLDRRLERLDPIASLPEPHLLARCLRHLRTRFELNRHHVEQVSAGTGLAPVILPYLPSGIRGHEDLLALANPLLEDPSEAAA